MNDDRKLTEKKMYREFIVTPGIAGWKIRIGCSELYFSDSGAVAAAIRDYLDDPVATEKQYRADDQRLCSSAQGQPIPARSSVGTPPDSPGPAGQLGEPGHDD